MNYAAIKNCDIANGPGVRVSLFVSGCRHHCKDCFNPETWDFACGEPFDEAVMDKLLALLAPGYIRGITYLGGEPFEPENQPGLLELSRRIKAAYPEKSIWSFTGYLFDRDILAKKLGPWEVTQELLSYLDVLVDGPFVASLKNLNLRFRGSSNQRLIDVPASLKTGAVVLWDERQEEEVYACDQDPLFFRRSAPSAKNQQGRLDRPVLRTDHDASRGGVCPCSAGRVDAAAGGV